MLKLEIKKNKTGVFTVKNKWGTTISILTIAIVIVFSFIFIGNESSASEKKVVSYHSAKTIVVKDMSRDIEEFQFIKDKKEQQLKEEQERLRLEQERLKKEEEERLRVEEQKRKEEERKALELKKQEEAKRLEEAKKRQSTTTKKTTTTTTTNNQTNTATKQPSQESKPTTTEKQTKPVYKGISAYEREVVRLTNIERVKNGLPELQMDSKLSEVAWYKSMDMQTVGYFAHTSPTYGSPFDMMTKFGLSYTAAGENIAYGYPSASGVVNGWMNSPGHRANILRKEFTHIGVGYYQNGHYATQMFMRK